MAQILDQLADVRRRGTGPLCQDTGIVTVSSSEVGMNVQWDAKLSVTGHG